MCMNTYLALALLSSPAHSILVGRSTGVPPAICGSLPQRPPSGMSCAPQMATHPAAAARTGSLSCMPKSGTKTLALHASLPAALTLPTARQASSLRSAQLASYLSWRMSSPDGSMSLAGQAASLSELQSLTSRITNHLCLSAPVTSAARCAHAHWERRPGAAPRRTPGPQRLRPHWAQPLSCAARWQLHIQAALGVSCLSSGASKACAETQRPCQTAVSVAGHKSISEAGSKHKLHKCSGNAQHHEAQEHLLMPHSQQLQAAQPRPDASCLPGCAARQLALQLLPDHGAARAHLCSMVFRCEGCISGSGDCCTMHTQHPCL